MEMRIRFTELLAERGWSAYAFAHRAEGRVSMSTAYRLAEKNGRLAMYDANLCEVLCDVFEVGPAELFEMDGAKPSGARKRKR
jgi:hypothetical protein